VKVNQKPPEGGFFVDFASIDWHQVSAEYLEFSAIAKDFFYYLMIPESFHYPLSGACTTVRYRNDVPDYIKRHQLSIDLDDTFIRPTH